RALNCQLQFINLEGLWNVPVGAHLHCLDRRVDRSISGYQYDWNLPMVFAHMSEDIETAHGFHFDIGDHDLRLNRVDLFYCFRCGVEWNKIGRASCRERV